MNLGIVGHEAAKFDARHEMQARDEIRRLIEEHHADLVISGHSPLGGIDWWAIEEAAEMGVDTLEFPPKVQRWEGGYKERNLQIAGASDLVVCIVVKSVPRTYKGQLWEACYHCKTPRGHHIKSGGCWTAKEARRIGKQSELVVIA